MAEAEVSLRLAFHLLSTRRATGLVRVAIDGAQVKVGDTIRFSIVEFMAAHGWRSETAGRWQAIYYHQTIAGEVQIHSAPGEGDVVATLAGNDPFVAEAKKGPIIRSRSSAEYPLLREALGQLLTIQELPSNAQLAVAVPKSPKFDELAARWREAPLIQKVGIRILTVARTGEVFGW
jgi:hypothetical protein